MEQVILVDEQDRETGVMEKMETHRRGLLHRAFSVFIFNSRHELLLQQRALHKYHSAGLWTNTCCSHPRPSEAVTDAAKRRLFEEMGLQTELLFKCHFIYKADVGNGLIEHEFDHVFVGQSDVDPLLNKEEAAAFKWMSVTDVKTEIALHPEQFTAWFKIAMTQFYS